MINPETARIEQAKAPDYLLVGDHPEECEQLPGIKFQTSQSPFQMDFYIVSSFAGSDVL
jgi:hypothetical protein